MRLSIKWYKENFYQFRPYAYGLYIDIGRVSLVIHIKEKKT